MPRKSSNPKTGLIATRVTPKIKIIIAQMAYREGLSVSEWLRNLIVVELKKNEALPMINRISDNFMNSIENEKIITA